MAARAKPRPYDILVAGGGTGGVPAAVAAARSGARVLLVERYGFLGGAATNALVYPYMYFSTAFYAPGGTQIVRGLFEEYLGRLEARRSPRPGRRRNDFETEGAKRVLDQMVLEAGIELKLHTQITGVTHKKGRIESVRLFHKGGSETVKARMFVDATGDGDLAAWAGAPFEIGRPEDGAVQPMTLNFRMANVDTDLMPPKQEINRLFDEAKARGEIRNPRENVLFMFNVEPGVVHFNTTRITGFDGLSAAALTAAEIDGRRQADEMVRFLKARVRGFENAYLMMTAPQIGVRESRRVLGSYVLTADDVLSCRKFKDGIACSNYEIDIHNPSGTGTVIRKLPTGDWYQIPYRCLIPLKTRNCLMACRAVSATHEAHASLRIMPVVWAMGQAAGAAAALCVRRHVSPANLSAALLRTTLRKQGAML